jgi:hypothetical protein
VAAAVVGPAELESVAVTEESGLESGLADSESEIVLVLALAADLGVRGGTAVSHEQCVRMQQLSVPDFAVVLLSLSLATEISRPPAP